MSIQKINTQVWLCYLKKKKTIDLKKKKQGVVDRYSSEPEKAHPTGELVIVASLVAVCCVLKPQGLQM